MKKIVQIGVVSVLLISFLGSCKKHYSCNTYVKVEQTTLDKAKI